jgi:hypothetical protein
MMMMIIIIITITTTIIIIITITTTTTTTTITHIVYANCHQVRYIESKSLKYLSVPAFCPIYVV